MSDMRPFGTCAAESVEAEAASPGILGEKWAFRCADVLRMVAADGCAVVYPALRIREEVDGCVRMVTARGVAVRQEVGQ